MKLFGEVVLAIVGIFALAFLLLTTSSRIHLPGFPSLYLVQSGSMEPTIKVADMVIVKTQSQYLKGDIITFYDSSHRVVTHRILSQEQDHFQTKGDANSTPDTSTISFSQIIGKVIFTLPKLGILVNLVHSSKGFIILIIVPAAIIIIDEFVKIFRHLSQRS